MEKHFASKYFKFQTLPNLTRLLSFEELSNNFYESILKKTFPFLIVLIT